MTFKKQFTRDCFLEALSKDKWKKNSDVAKEVGCSARSVTNNMLKMYDIVPTGRLSDYNVYNSTELVECRWVKGGAKGTRAWRLK